MIMCILLCYPVSFHMLQLLLTGRPISSLKTCHIMCQLNVIEIELSNHVQIFPALLQQQFDQICSWWHHLKIDFFYQQGQQADTVCISMDALSLS